MLFSSARSLHTTESCHGVVLADVVERLARAVRGVADLPGLCGRERQLELQAIFEDDGVRVVLALRRFHTFVFLAAALLPGLGTYSSMPGVARARAALPDIRLLFLRLSRGPPH
jgi:hypothetical protein